MLDAPYLKLSPNFAVFTTILAVITRIFAVSTPNFVIIPILPPLLIAARGGPPSLPPATATPLSFIKFCCQNATKHRAMQQVNLHQCSSKIRYYVERVSDTKMLINISK